MNSDVLLEGLDELCLCYGTDEVLILCANHQNILVGLISRQWLTGMIDSPELNAQLAVRLLLAPGPRVFCLCLKVLEPLLIPCLFVKGLIKQLQRVSARSQATETGSPENDAVYR